MHSQRLFRNCPIFYQTSQQCIYFGYRTCIYYTFRRVVLCNDTDRPLTSPCPGLIYVNRNYMYMTEFTAILESVLYRFKSLNKKQLKNHTNTAAAPSHPSKRQTQNQPSTSPKKDTSSKPIYTLS